MITSVCTSGRTTSTLMLSSQPIFALYPLTVQWGFRYSAVKLASKTTALKRYCGIPQFGDIVWHRIISGVSIRTKHWNFAGETCKGGEMQTRYNMSNACGGI